LPEAFPVPAALTTTCDDEIDPLVQDGKYPFNTSSFDATILNGQTGMTIIYFTKWKSFQLCNIRYRNSKCVVVKSNKPTCQLQ
jgi:hypothetical protein